jgi:8-oxo-dGTP pyrophosphatase MutT (NUDIX family)
MSPGDVRKSVGAAAVIFRRVDDERRWLVRWNRNWECYYFVGGHKHEDESFRKCVVREVTEELGITEGLDFVVSQEPLTYLRFRADSRGAGVETEYTFALFGLEFLGDSVRKRLEGDERLRWVSGEEIKAGRSADGRDISPTMKRVLQTL